MLADDAPLAAPRKRVSKQHSRVTNGTALFSATIRDGRSGWSRRVNDLISLYIVDLGGEDTVSEAERSIVRRIACGTVELEWIEQKFALSSKGPAPEELDLYFRVSNSLRRQLEAIGLKRVMKDVTPPSLDDIAAEYEVEEAAANGGIE
jgi:hypothetical protein